MIFKIELVNVKNPKVLRTISIPSVMTFSQMHLAIQIAFGWDNAHLYDFRNQGSKSLSAYHEPILIEKAQNLMAQDPKYFMSGMFKSRKKAVDSDTVVLGKYFRAQEDFMIYTYDFGDSWAHKVTLVEASDEGQPAYPVCIEGSGMCPVEDCGGFPGWDFLKSCIARLKDVGARALDSDSRENLEWAFGSLASARRVNLDRVDIASVNRTLSRVFGK